MSTLEEWLADPDGNAALHAAIGTDTDGRPRGILGDKRRLRVIGNFPIRTLAAFHVGITHELVESLIAARGSA
jgi:beta-glucosidase